MSDPAFLTIAAASKLIAARKLSPVELTEAYLGRIAKFDSLLDSFVTLTAERARAEAKAAEAAVMAGKPLGRQRHEAVQQAVQFGDPGEVGLCQFDR